MDELELRAFVAKRLKKPDVPQAVWDELSEQGLVDAAKDGERDEREDLVRAARRSFRISRAIARWESVGPRVVEERLAFDPGAYVKERSRAAAEAVALEASREPQVRKFRRRFLGGGPLSPTDADRLLASPAAALLEERWFEAVGVPVVGHHSREVARTIEDDEVPADRVAVDLLVEERDGRHETHVSWRVPIDPIDSLLGLEVLDDRGRHRTIDVRRHSVLDHLRELSRWLTDWYAWQAGKAAWFVLTDALPIEGAIRVGFRVEHIPAQSRARVTIEAEPWVPADLVERAYRDVQKGLLGRENRPIAIRNLSVMRAVTAGEREAERQTPGGSIPTRAEAMDLWNTEHPEAPYSTTRVFDRDLKRARQAVLFPRFTTGKTESSEQ